MRTEAISVFSGEVPLIPCGGVATMSVRVLRGFIRELVIMHHRPWRLIAAVIGEKPLARAVGCVDKPSHPTWLPYSMTEADGHPFAGRLPIELAAPGPEHFVCFTVKNQSLEAREFEAALVIELDD